MDHLYDTVRVHEFLAHEAELLDAGNLTGWLELLTEDIRYLAPVRSTRYGRHENEFSSTSFHFEEDHYSLTMRIRRLDTKFAWAEDPPTRTRHLIGNVRVLERGAAEVVASSAFMLYRSRLDEPTGEMLTGRRRDVLREDSLGGLRLADRLVLVDQTTLPVSTLSTFL